jgi:eukaryotic-like serine/threonine-protein kinase
MESGSVPTSTLANRYQLQQLIATGGMAVVYLARDEMLERPVAIKILRQDFSRDDNFRERFRQEAKAAANLSHPNIVTIHDFGLDKGRLYIVMEHVPGTDLKAMLKQQRYFTVDQAIPLIVQACAGIGYAHRAGLVHCDVKPHNMLVTPDQRLKVTDFGIARALSSIHPDEQHDVVWGSPQYFSPEQASGAAPSPASDVYSLGVILYEMLTGQLPFTSEDPVELARMHREYAPLPPRQLNPAIPPALEQILLKVLSKEPSSRYRTADQLGRILVSFSQQADPYAANIPTSIGPATPPVVQSVSPRNPSSGVSASVKPVRPQKASALDFDWLSVGLGLIALTAVGGLIPFWLYIWLTLTSTRAIP